MTEDICTEKTINDFSLQHYTYINQIFGDAGIRDIISDVYPSEKYKFGVEDTDEAFEHSNHHILVSKKDTSKIVCSVINGYQNININKNDTLCQSYSLLSYFGIKIDKSQKQRQFDMIKMYRRLLKNPKFIDMLDEIIHSGNRRVWKDYTKVSGTYYVVMNKAAILAKIDDVLNKWEKYGYWFFINDGTCPKKKTAKMVSPVRLSRTKTLKDQPVSLRRSARNKTVKKKNGDSDNMVKSMAASKTVERRSSRIANRGKTVKGRSNVEQEDP